MTRRRVVVTGIGLLTPIGNDVDSAWANALAGRSGAGPIEQFDATNFSVNICAPVASKDYRPKMPCDMLLIPSVER